MTKAKADLFSSENILYRGDCLSVLDKIPLESVDLVYIDPPFYSNRYYELIWKDESERFAFEDRFRGGIAHYSEWLMERITRLWGVVSPSGSFVVHLDGHAVHYIKVEMDRLRVGKFRNEIIWHYTNKLGTGGRVLDRQHDSLLWYSKGPEWTFKPLYEPVKLAKPQPVTKKVKGDRIWLRNASGERLYKKSKDKRIGDVWDLPIINPMSKERTGYPTQKPLVLMNRVIDFFTKPGDLVLDAFCGCGTTLEAAQLMGRRWIGIDVSQIAIKVVQKRLKGVYHTITTHGLANTISDLEALSWQEFQAWAVSSVFGRHSPKKIADMGIDGFSYLENNPIQVKQASGVGRPVIDAFLGVLQRENAKRGMIIALSFSRGAHEEVARAKRDNSVDIELITPLDILENKVKVGQLA